MKLKSLIIILSGICAFVFSGCKKDWLERQSKTLIVDEQTWNDPKLVVALIANYYDRLPTDQGLIDDNETGGAAPDGRRAQWRNMADYDEAIWSGYSGEDGRNNIVSYATDRWTLWNYTLIRDINLALENIESKGDKLTTVQKAQFSAELRFIRAFDYFEMVKRMGGVPLVTKQLIYDYSGNASPLQTARAKESDVYDFIANEMDAIKNDIGNGTSTTRANKYTALALKSRALLYAGSIAKYNGLMASPISTTGGEVGIPAAKATDYYTRSLAASKEIISSGAYSLYKANPNLGENFYEAVMKKTSNPEIIFVKDYLSAKNKRHAFSYDNIPRNLREDNLGSSCITPTLNLVESYEYLDGSNGALKIRTANDQDFIYYNNTTDIFANKDARLFGTVIYPGATFKGLTVQMQAGIMVWNATTSTYATIEDNDLGTVWGGTKYPAGDGKLLTASGGPHRSIQEVSNSGFYLRKFVDAGAGTSTRGLLSDVWWVRFRMGEIYLNAGEAAYELGQTNESLTYINALRERAGFGANSVTGAKLTIGLIRNERRVELAFEDHRVWDLRRWRIADQVWNGNSANPDAVMYALYPYRVVRPGDPTRDGKYVFVKLKAPRFIAPRFFQVQNYYAFVPQNVRDNNPLIVRNPFQ